MKVVSNHNRPLGRARVLTRRPRGRCREGATEQHGTTRNSARSRRGRAEARPSRTVPPRLQASLPLSGESNHAFATFADFARGFLPARGAPMERLIPGFRNFGISGFRGSCAGRPSNLKPPPAVLPHPADAGSPLSEGAAQSARQFRSPPDASRPPNLLSPSIESNPP